MTGTGPTDLKLLCDDLLNAAVEALDTIPDFAPDLVGAPARAYVSPGLPALDCCDQLTVHAQQISDKPISPGGLQAGKKCAARLAEVALVVTITRCIPIMGDSEDWPLPVVMDDAAAQLDADAWALWEYLYFLVCSEALFSLCKEVFWDGLTALVPQGGCGGWVMNLRVTLDGYEVVVGS
jgi:hypothetical protein